VHQDQQSPASVPALLSRRPILDPEGRVRGQELRFRGDGPSERATAATFVLGTGDHDLGTLTGGVPAWIAVSREFLLTFDPLPLAPRSAVLMLEPGAEVDDELVRRVLRLRAEGHALALDDFLPREALEPLVPLANFVRLDLPSLGLAGISAVAAGLPPQRPRVVVTGVVSPSQHDSLVRRGADLLQGFHFALPRTSSGRPVPVASVDRIRAVIALRDAPSFEQVERVVAEDPGLAVRLLRLANSAAAGGRRRLSSIRDALVLLGSERVRQFLLLVLLGELGEGRPALVTSAVLRGRLCETVARDLATADPDTAFTAGVLSTVDALLDRPMKEVLKELPITEELRWAILGHSGPVGAALALALRIEAGTAGAAGARYGRLEETLGWTDRAVGGLT
jgi:c-di-GMP phosphodiesterase